MNDQQCINQLIKNTPTIQHLQQQLANANQNTLDVIHTYAQHLKRTGTVRRQEQADTGSGRGIRRSNKRYRSNKRLRRGRKRKRTTRRRKR